MRPTGADSEGSEGLITVRRGLEVLRTFRAESKPRSNAELVKLTGFSKAAVSRLTSTLMELGYLRRASCGRLFEISSGVLGIGHSFIANDPIQSRAHPYMEELANRLDASIALATGEGLDVLYVAYQVSRNIVSLRMGLGSLVPMATTMIGRTYLWGLPNKIRRAQVERLRADYAGQGATDSQLEAWDRELYSAFGDLEAHGVCYAKGGPGFQRNAIGVGMPVRVGKQQLHMALSFGSVEPPSRQEAKRRRLEHALLKARPDFEALLADIDLDK